MQFISELLALGVKPVQEPTAITERYEEGNEFDADMDSIKEKLDEVLEVVNSSNMKQHIKDTKENFGVDTNKEHVALEKAVTAAIHAYHDFYDKMGEAE